MLRSSALNWRLEYLKEKTANLIKRLELIKDSDPFNKRILNDCYVTIQELTEDLKTLERQLYELAGTEQKL
jgi:hypothetical protein